MFMTTGGPRAATALYEFLPDFNKSLPFRGWGSVLTYDRIFNRGQQASERQANTNWRVHMNLTNPQRTSSRRTGRTSLMLATAFLVALFSLGLAGNAFGQDQQAPPPDQSGQGMGGHMGRRQMPSVDDQIKHLSKKLNLSSDQQAKLKPILEDQRKQMEAIH